MNPPKCTNCGKEGEPCWTLTGYYGIWGSFCGKCYDKVSHDSYRKPKNPREYAEILWLQKLKGVK